MAQEGDPVTISQACKWSDVSRRSFYYRAVKSAPKVNEHLAARVKRFINAFPHTGYRRVAWALGESRNTIQRIFQLEGLQVWQRASGARPRVQNKTSVTSAPDVRWSTDTCRVWCGSHNGWCALTLVMDCHTRELLGWSLSPKGDAKAAEAALEEALIYRSGSLMAPRERIVLRSDNGLVFTPKLYTKAAKRYGFEQEFIRPHTPQQNGLVERFIRTVKTECVEQHNWQSVEEAKRCLDLWFKYYNEERPHQALKMKTPSMIYQQLAA
ncbi:IS2 transposase TnpB [Oligella urethralis]|uniref:IS3 family transposase n=1 Tax=Oligella urethralis TaxID=90245 RepID=UPI000DFC05CD|nr:IS3 family transposase [Oligella urethralis]SUA55829.1 IS2 transposase TnpB [Oligella urethralis]